MPVAIVDYGMANLRSVAKAFEAVGVESVIVSSPGEVAAADRIVLPGVGAFKDAVATLRSTGLDAPIIDHIRRDRPMLGICLGLQMLFDTGYEDGEHRGLGVLQGDCIRFDVDSTMNLKVPHMGWNQLDRVGDTPLLAGLSDSPSVYFVHGYHVRPKDAALIATTTGYGRRFVSSIRRGNLVATQFHPEKSQSVGLKMLENFAAM